MLENQIAARKRRVDVAVRIVFRRIVDDTGQYRAFFDRQFGGRLVEQYVRRRPQPVHTVAEVQDIEIGFEYFVLAVTPFEFARNAHFGNFTADRFFVAQMRVLDQLLADSRRALAK